MVGKYWRPLSAGIKVDGIIETLDHFVAPSAALLPRWEAVRGKLHSLSFESWKRIVGEFGDLYVGESRKHRWNEALIDQGYASPEDAYVLDGSLVSHLMVNCKRDFWEDLEPMREPIYVDLELVGHAVAAIECEILPVN